MAVAPIKKPPAPTKVPAPDPFDMDAGGDAEEEVDDLFPVFLTETITPPPVKERGQRGPSLHLPFAKLDKVGRWFLCPPFPVDKDAKKKQKQKLASYVYKKQKGELAGRKFKLIEIDTRFANDIHKPELVGRYGVWRVL